MPYVGTMPTSKNEIATDTIILDALGLPHELGQTIELEYYIKDKLCTREFILSGIYEGDILTNTSNVWVSLALLHEIESENNIYITDIKTVKIMFSNTMNIEIKLIRIINDSGYSIEDLNFYANGAYQIVTGSGIDFSAIMAAALLFLVIIFTGYLVIYNMFSISISKDIRFYGMLKTIGTTPRQIRKIIRGQVFRLAIIGIPIGLLLGFITGILLTPIIIASVNIDEWITSFNPIIFIGSALFALLTVYIGSRKPAKIASLISPVDALKYQDSIIKKTSRKSNNTKIYKLALNNLLRDKKKTIIILTTMFLSLLILNSAYVVSKGMSVDKYLDFMMPSDYVVASTKYFNYRFDENYDYVSSELIDEIDNSNLVENSSKIYEIRITHDLSDKVFKKYKSDFENEDMDDYYKDAVKQYTQAEIDIPLNVYGLNEYGINKLDTKTDGLDIEEFMSGKHIILGAFSDISTESPYEIGDDVILGINGKTEIYEVIAIASLPYSMSVKFYEPGSIDCLIPSTEFENIFEKPSVMSYIFDVKDGDEDDMERLLKDFTTEDDVTMNYQSKQTLGKEFDGTSRMFIIVGGMLSFVIGLISIANFINSLLASIITRKTELAMMKSIGMTNKQLRRMLGFEGIYYGGLSVVLALVIEMGSRNFLARTFASSMWAFDYKFSILPLLIVAPIVILISIAIPYFANRKASNISLIEQLRGIE